MLIGEFFSDRLLPSVHAPPSNSVPTTHNPIMIADSTPLTIENIVAFRQSRIPLSCLSDLSVFLYSFPFPDYARKCFTSSPDLKILHLLSCRFVFAFSATPLLPFQISLPFSSSVQYIMQTASVSFFSSNPFLLLLSCVDLDLDPHPSVQRLQRFFLLFRSSRFKFFPTFFTTESWWSERRSPGRPPLPAEHF